MTTSGGCSLIRFVRIDGFLSKYRPFMTQYLRLIAVSLLALSAFCAGCSELFGDTPLWDRPGQNPVDQPDLTGVEWQEVEGPALGAHRSHGSSSLVERLDHRVYVRHFANNDRIIGVDANGAWHDAQPLDGHGVTDAQIESVTSVMGQHWILAEDATYRRSDDGTWSRQPHRFSRIVEAGGDVFALTPSSEEPGETLYRQSGDGNWQQVLENVRELGSSGDILHAMTNQGVRFSQDGGDTWERVPYHTLGYRFLIRSAQAVAVDGIYWRAADSLDWEGPAAFTSTNGLDWQAADRSEVLEGLLIRLMAHRNSLYGIEERKARDGYSNQHRLLRLAEEGWEEVKGPLGAQVIDVQSLENTLVVLTSGAGLWHSADEGHSWQPYDVSLDDHEEIAQSETVVCVRGGLKVVACREHGTERWHLEHLPEGTRVSRFTSLPDQILVHALQETDDGDGKSRMGRITESGHLEWITPRLFDTSHLEMVGVANSVYVLWYNKVYEFSRGEDVYVGEGGRFEGDTIYTEPRGRLQSLTKFAGVLWVLDVTDDGKAQVNYQSREANVFERLPVTLPEAPDAPGELESFRFEALHATRSHLYLVARHRREVQERDSVTRTEIFRLVNSRWQRTKVPSPAELGGRRFEAVRASSTTVYAATDTDLYRYVFAKDRWENLTAELDRQIVPDSLSVAGDRVWVSVVGEGLWRLHPDA